MKTIKDIYKAVLIEQNKLQAPSLKLYEFNYFLNKAILQVINKKYNVLEVNLQITDDLLGLFASAQLTKVSEGYNLPSDYMHLLNCICTFENKCNKQTLATKLTSNIEGEIINNYYNKPSINKPYFKLSGDKLIILSGEALPSKVTILYIKKPTEYTLTLEELNDVSGDATLISEFSDYMIKEIINELIYLALERVMDPRLANNTLITLTIANPTQLVLS